MAEAGDLIAGRYLLQELIGRGGMGTVWLARDLKLRRPVAVKCGRLDDEKAAQRLENEAVNAGGLHHRNIVEVFDFFDEGGQCWIAMEYVPSRSLAQLVDAEGPLTPEQAAAIGRQIADALAKSHGAGVVHGDVTPENILVTDDHSAKLTDFGISRALWDEATRTRTGGVPGKPQYLAPELARDGRRADRSSDMFSLGASLFAAIEGHSPYGRAEHPAAYVARAAHGEVEAPRRAGPLTGPLAALLEVEPRRRPSAAEAARLLGDVARPGDGSRIGRDPSPSPSWSRSWSPLRAKQPDDPWWRTFTVPPLPPLPPPVRRHPSLAAAVALVTVMAAVVAVGYVVGDDRDPAAAGPGTSSGASGTASDPGAGPVAVVGDLKTADPCALLDTRALSRFGDVEMDTDYGELDRCDVLVSRRGSDELIADVRVNFASEPAEFDSQVRTERTGSVTVAELPSDDAGACDRNLQLADGNQVWITAEEEGPSLPDVCALADAAVAHAVGKLNEGPVPRRSQPFHEDSLARVDACALLDAAALSVLPGVDTQDPEPDFANWGCDWSTSNGDSGVELTFDRDNSLADNGDPVRLGGRRSTVSPKEWGDDTCVVRTAHRQYTNVAGDTTIELVTLNVYGPRPSRELCDTAKALATAAAKRLPKP